MSVEITFAQEIDGDARTSLQKLVAAGWLAGQRTGGGPLVAVTFSSYPGGFNFGKYQALAGTCYRAKLTVGRTEE